MKSASRYRKYLVGFLFCLTNISLLSPAYAAEPSPTLAPLRAAVSEHFPHGLERKILQALADRMGRQITFMPYPFARRLDTLEKGGVDLSTGLLKTPERTEKLIFIDAHKRKTYRAFFVLKDRATRIEKYEDLYGLKVGTRIKSLYFDRFDKDDKIQKIPVTSIESHIHMLLNGRIDTFAFQEKSGLLKIAELGYEGKIIAAPYKFSRTNLTHICISKKSPLANDLTDINRVIKEMSEDGTFRQITEDHYRNLQN
ncbi:substrate-binding periplasmic protein [Paremcibacter congregatus]|uniref:substrate-binding periplasmic protein n=1 Tax=Paremcibacter congregatus TaxID=2043170 RepID=UPI0030EE68E8